MGLTPRLCLACACLAVAAISSRPGPAAGSIMQVDRFAIDLADAADAARKAEWSDPDRVRVHADGLGWGERADEGSRDFRLRTTEPIALGLSWRPTSAVTIRATVDGPAESGALYARYGADASHWSAWQYLGAPAPAGDRAQRFQAELRVPRLARVRYDELLNQYFKREDVPWRSDEEALVKEVLRREPDFFATTAPFIGYVQLLYEGQLPGGRRIKGLAVDLSWGVGGIHMAPTDRAEEGRRNGPWRFKAP